MFQHANKHRRNELAVRDGISLNCFQSLARIELLHHDDGAAQRLDDHGPVRRRCVMTADGIEIYRVVATLIPAVSSSTVGDAAYRLGVLCDSGRRIPFDCGGSDEYDIAFRSSSIGEVGTQQTIVDGAREFLYDDAECR